MLYVTLTTPGRSRIISLASSLRILKESGVGVATRASILSQQRTSISGPKLRNPSRMPVTGIKHKVSVSN